MTVIPFPRPNEPYLQIWSYDPPNPYFPVKYQAVLVQPDGKWEPKGPLTTLIFAEFSASVVTIRQGIRRRGGILSVGTWAQPEEPLHG